MQTVLKPDKISAGPQRRKPGKILLIVAVVFFILMFVPDPIKFIPFVGEGEELAEGGIGLSALLIYAVRYWLYKNVKEQITGK